MGLQKICLMIYLNVRVINKIQKYRVKLYSLRILIDKHFKIVFFFFCPPDSIHSHVRSNLITHNHGMLPFVPQQIHYILLSLSLSPSLFTVISGSFEDIPVCILPPVQFPFLTSCSRIRISSNYSSER